MHVLFVHKNFPAQFGHIARWLVEQRGYRCSFVSEHEPGSIAGVDRIQYALRGGATDATHYLSRTFENGVWHAASVYEALRPAHAALKPDLIVGHSGFGSTVFLPELFPGTPVINYFEYFYRPRDSDLDFRPEQPVAERDRLRSRARNAMILLDLEYCSAGYAPTEFQWSLFPEAYKPKLRVLHDGIDTEFWSRRPPAGRTLGSLELGPDTRLVTYVSRGLESMRGFDVFMRAAKRVCDEYDDVRIVVVGDDRVAYGGDLAHTGGKSFKQWVLERDDYDLDRILFAGRVAPTVLAQLLSLSDVHVYLTVPFVLSWSLLNAMACECVVVGSDTAPVREFVRDGETGLLADFFDADGIAERVLGVLRDPGAHRRLGEAARAEVERRVGMEAVMPQMLDFYEKVAQGQDLG